MFTTGPGDVIAEKSTVGCWWYYYDVTLFHIVRFGISLSDDVFVSHLLVGVWFLQWFLPDFYNISFELQQK